MLSGKLMLMSAAALLGGTILFAADDASAPAPAHHSTKLTKPYSELTGLTDDQTSKIEDIHADFLAQQKVLMAKEKKDIEAILTDDQKEELKTLTKKEKPSKKKEATTEPAQ